MKLTTLVASVLLVIFVFACDQSTPPFFEVVDTAEGITQNGYAYLDITIENTSNGTGKFVTCKVTATESRSNEVLAETTALFADGVNIRSEGQITERVLLYRLSVLELLVEYEEVEGTERVALDPIVTYTFDLSWEDVGL